MGRWLVGFSDAGLSFTRPSLAVWCWLGRVALCGRWGLRRRSVELLGGCAASGYSPVSGIFCARGFCLRLSWEVARAFGGSGFRGLGTAPTLGVRGGSLCRPAPSMRGWPLWIRFWLRGSVDQVGGPADLGNGGATTGRSPAGMRAGVGGLAFASLLALVRDSVWLSLLFR